MNETEAIAAGFTCVPPTIRPVLVQFYRCGRAQRDRGWVKCTVPATCEIQGCLRAKVGGRDNHAAD